MKKQCMNARGGGFIRTVILGAAAMVACSGSAALATEIEPSSVRATYFWMKRKVQASFVKCCSQLEAKRGEPFRLDELMLWWQNTDSAITHHGVSREEVLAVLASQVIASREVASATGYPKTLWLNELINIEEDFLGRIERTQSARDVLWDCVRVSSTLGESEFHALIDQRGMGHQSKRDSDIEEVISDCIQDSPVIEEMDRAFEKFYEKLDNYAEQNPKNVSALERREIGGELAFWVSIDWSPTKGSLRVIPLFYFQLCALRAIDPHDPIGCPQWREVLDSEIYGGGDYRFLATWPNGRSRSGQLSISLRDKGRKWLLAP